MMAKILPQQFKSRILNLPHSQYWLWILKAWFWQFFCQSKHSQPGHRKHYKHKILKLVSIQLFFRFFFDLHQPILFELTFLTLSYATVAIAIFGVGFDGLFLSFSANIVSHFMILQRNLKEMTGDVVEFEKLVKYHNEILRNCEKLFDLYRPFMFSQFIYVSTSFCVIGFSIMVVSRSW